MRPLLFALLLFAAMPAAAQDLDGALRFLEQNVPAAMSQTQTPGLAVAVVKEGRVVYRQGFGHRRLGEPDPVTPSTVFQIGSISKSLTAMAVAMLVDQGLAKWDDRVVDHLPQFAMHDPWVTREFRIFDLMAQHTGLPHTSGDMQILSGVDRDHIVRSLRHIEPESSFRSHFAYQNAPFLAAAQLIEAKTGKRWEDVLAERIFQPLGMATASTDWAGYLAASERAGFHQLQEDRVSALPWDWPYFDYVYLLGPAGGVNATADDMARLLGFWLEEASPLVSAEQKAFLQRPQTVVNTGAYYCQALIRMERPGGACVWHNGETSGAKNMMAFLPDEKLGIVVLTNLRGNGLPEWLAFSFFDVYKERAPRPFDPHPELTRRPERPASPAAPRPLERYRGRFTNPVYGDLVVDAAEHLTLRFASETTQRALDPWDGDTFWLELPVIDQPTSGPVHFTFDDAGAVTSVRLESFDAGKIGTFRKVP